MRLAPQALTLLVACSVASLGTYLPAQSPEQNGAEAGVHFIGAAESGSDQAESGGDCCCASNCCDCQSAAAAAVPDYTGCLCCREYFTGNWCGRRTCLLENGIVFEGDVTQYYQGIVDGGEEQLFEYGGHSDLVFNTDFGKLGVQEGLFLKVRGETQFGRFVNNDTGALIPVNTEGMIPLVNEHEIALTNFLFTQFFSETFGVFAGKLDTLDGDANAFAHGRGKDQFLNSAFVINQALLRITPYSSLGVGFVVLHEKQPIFTFTAIDSTDRASTFGLDDFAEDGMSFFPELRLPTQFFGLPGHQLFGAGWSSRNYTILDQDFRLILPPNNLPVERGDDSWALYYNFDQYLVVDPCNPQRGWGVFGRAAVADEETNPVGWFGSLGIGGSSPFGSRPKDTFGIGYYKIGASEDLPPLLNVHDGDGFEAFYNIEVNPWFNLTVDLQVIEPGFEGSPVLEIPDPERAVVVGLRGKVTL